MLDETTDLFQSVSFFNQIPVYAGSAGTESFPKEPKFKEIIARIEVDAYLVPCKKSTGFSRMSVTQNFLCFGTQLRNNF